MLQIARIKPNPSGKDRLGGWASASQLAAEWVDVTNTSAGAVTLNGIGLYHRAFSGGSSRWEHLVDLSGVLPAGKTLRVHSGRGGIAVVHVDDLMGADYHQFIGEDRYVWNNREGDTPLLWNDARKAEVDHASYDPNPPEGAILIRVGDRLVPASSRTWVR